MAERGAFKYKCFNQNVYYPKASMYMPRNRLTRVKYFSNLSVYYRLVLVWSSMVNFKNLHFSPR